MSDHDREAAPPALVAQPEDPLALRLELLERTVQRLANQLERGSMGQQIGDALDVALEPIWTRLDNFAAALAKIASDACAVQPSSKRRRPTKRVAKRHTKRKAALRP